MGAAPGEEHSLVVHYARCAGRKQGLLGSPDLKMVLRGTCPTWAHESPLPQGSAITPSMLHRKELHRVLDKAANRPLQASLPQHYTG